MQFMLNEPDITSGVYSCAIFWNTVNYDVLLRNFLTLLFVLRTRPLRNPEAYGKVWKVKVDRI